MTGLKPVDDDDDEDQGDNKVEVVPADDQPKRVAFGAIDGSAWVLYEDGHADVGTENQVATLPPQIMESLAREYAEQFL